MTDNSLTRARWVCKFGEMFVARNLVVNFDESSVSKGRVNGVKSTALTEFCELFDLRQISFFFEKVELT